MHIKILQINIRSLTHNKNILEVFMEKEGVDICILSEVWLKAKQYVKFTNYNLFVNPRDSTHPSGGVAFLIKKSLITNFTLINDVSPMEAAEIEILNTGTQYIMATFYMPEANPNVMKNSMKKIIGKIQRKNKCNCGRRHKRTPFTMEQIRKNG